MHQSCRWSIDWRVNQMLLTVHNLYKAFDAYAAPQTYAVFLDISKAFDKVWLYRLIFKPKSVGVSDSLLSLIENFLSNIFQSSAKCLDIWMINRQTWFTTRFHLWSAFFPNLVSTAKLFVYGTALFSVVRDSYISANELNSDLQEKF